MIFVLDLKLKSQAGKLYKYRRTASEPFFESLCCLDFIHKFQDSFSNKKKNFSIDIPSHGNQCFSFIFISPYQMTKDGMLNYCVSWFV